ncbi:hypothetical protein KY330_05175 [Candidatus Woesearchaeota archaeon]|nr:hypothetical protein [Candidatus Woesearchaeota archaeon]
MKRYKEWDCEERAYTREATVEVNDFDERDCGELEKYLKSYGTMSEILSNSLGRFRVKKKEIERHTKKRGRINQRYVKDELVRLHSGQDLTQKVYDRRINQRRQLLKLNMSLGIILDQSGSTRFSVDGEHRRIDLIKYATLTIGRSLRNIDEPFFVYSFHSYRDADPTIMERLKTTAEPWDRRIEERISALEHTACTEYFNNKDGAAIRFANEELLKMPEPRYLFIVTDGFPNCDYAYYQDDIAYHDTMKAMEEGKELGIRYVYLTINPQRCADFMKLINPVTMFSKRYTRMQDIIEGLTLVYEKIKERKC